MVRPEILDENEADHRGLVGLGLSGSSFSRSFLPVGTAPKKIIPRNFKAMCSAEDSPELHGDISQQYERLEWTGLLRN